MNLTISPINLKKLQKPSDIQFRAVYINQPNDEYINSTRNDIVTEYINIDSKLIKLANAYGHYAKEYREILNRTKEGIVINGFQLRTQKTQLKTKAEETAKEIKILRERKRVLLNRINPNAAFLIEGISKERKLQKLKQHPEIVRISKIQGRSGDENVYRNLIIKKNYFLKVTSDVGTYIDTSHELNKENYEKLNKPTIKNINDLADYFELDMETTANLIKKGYIKPIQLKSITTGKMEPIALYDLDDEENKKGLKACEAIVSLTPKKSPYLESGAKEAPASVFESMGFPSEDVIKKEIIYKRIDGRIIKKDGEEKVLVNIGSRKTKGNLNFLRTSAQPQLAVTIKEFAQIAHCDQETVEKDLLDGTLEEIKEYIFMEDRGKILLDTRNPKNKEFLQKMKLENTAKKYIAKSRDLSQSEDGKPAKSVYSLKDTMILRLCPQIKSNLNKLIKTYPQEAKLFTKDTKTKEEKEIIRKFLDEFWKITDINEAKTVLERVEKSIKQYFDGGINAIVDMESRNIIRDYLALINSPQFRRPITGSFNGPINS